MVIFQNFFQRGHHGNWFIPKKKMVGRVRDFIGSVWPTYKIIFKVIVDGSRKVFHGTVFCLQRYLVSLARWHRLSLFKFLFEQVFCLVLASYSWIYHPSHQCNCPSFIANHLLWDEQNGALCLVPDTQTINAIMNKGPGGTYQLYRHRYNIKKQIENLKAIEKKSNHKWKSD